MINEVVFEYVGDFYNREHHYEVIEDTTNKMYLIIYKNPAFKDVECYSFSKEKVLERKGDTVIQKIQNAWRIALFKLAYKNEAPLGQFFPLEFWEDVIVPLKKNNKIELNAFSVEKPSLK